MVTTRIYLTVLAIIIVLVFQTMRMTFGQELSSAERLVLRLAKQICERGYSGPPSKDSVSKYCDCYAFALAKEITKDELLTTRVTPELKQKMARASAACPEP